MIAALVLLFAGAAGAEEIKLVHRGTTLNGEPMLAEGKPLADGVVLLPNGRLLHSRAERDGRIKSPTVADADHFFRTSTPRNSPMSLPASSRRCEPCAS
jgi:hypothetical protein